MRKKKGLKYCGVAQVDVYNKHKELVAQSIRSRVVMRLESGFIESFLQLMM